MGVPILVAPALGGSAGLPWRNAERKARERSGEGGKRETERGGKEEKGKNIKKNIKKMS